MCKGITFLSLLVSTLYCTTIIKINGIYIHHVNIILLLVLICFLVDDVHLIVSLVSADFFVVVDLYALCTLLFHMLGII